MSEFLLRPELEIAGWRARLPLHELVHGNVWGQPVSDARLAATVSGPATFDIERQTP